MARDWSSNTCVHLCTWFSIIMGWIKYLSSFYESWKRWTIVSSTITIWCHWYLDHTDNRCINNIIYFGCFIQLFYSSDIFTHVCYIFNEIVKWRHHGYKCTSASFRFCISCGYASHWFHFTNQFYSIWRCKCKYLYLSLARFFFHQYQVNMSVPYQFLNVLSSEAFISCKSLPVKATVKDPL